MTYLVRRTQGDDELPMPVKRRDYDRIQTTLCSRYRNRNSAADMIDFSVP